MFLQRSYGDVMVSCEPMLQDNLLPSVKAGGPGHTYSLEQKFAGRASGGRSASPRHLLAEAPGTKTA